MIIEVRPCGEIPGVEFMFKKTIEINQISTIKIKIITKSERYLGGLKFYH